MKTSSNLTQFGTNSDIPAPRLYPGVRYERQLLYVQSWSADGGQTRARIPHLGPVGSGYTGDDQRHFEKHGKFYLRHCPIRSFC